MNSKTRFYQVLYADTGEVKILKGTHYLRKNFQVWEFASKCGNEIIIVNNKSLDKLQELRSKIGKVINLISGFRSYSHNKKVGGAADSRHLHGDAYDMEIPKGYSLKGFTKVVEDVFGHDSGVSMYPSSNTPFVHADTRGYHWRGIDGKTVNVERLVA